ncbi:hypothetical protein GCM10023075_58410 [Streptosporangium album]
MQINWERDVRHSRDGGWNGNAKSPVRSAGIPADQATVRRSNLSLVLRHVSEHGSRSRSLVAAETGLNKTTVTSLIDTTIGIRRITTPSPEGNADRVPPPFFR